MYIDISIQSLTMIAMAAVSVVAIVRLTNNKGE